MNQGTVYEIGSAVSKVVYVRASFFSHETADTSSREEDLSQDSRARSLLFTHAARFASRTRTRSCGGTRVSNKFFECGPN